MNSTPAITQITCHEEILEPVRMFGLFYFSILIVFGTIGNILILLVIQGVGKTRRVPSYPCFKSSGIRRTQETMSIIGPSGDAVNPRPSIRRTSSIPSITRQTSNTSISPLTFGPYRGKNISICQPAGVYKRQPLRKHPSRHIFTALTVTDSIVLWVNPVRYWIMFAFGFDIRQNDSVFMCRAHTFLTYATRDAAIWVLCLLTFERFLIGCFPHKAKMMWRGRRKVAAWLSIFVVILAKNSVLLFILQLIYANDADDWGIAQPGRANMTQLVICDTFDLVTRKVFFYLDIVFYSLIPTCLLLVLNIALFRVIRKTTKMRRGYALACLHSKQNQSNACKITPVDTEVSQQHGKIMRGASWMVKRSVIQANKLLIPVSLFHLLTSVPICIFSIVEDSMQLKRSPSHQTRCILNACGYLFVMLGATNYGVNCVLYFLSSKHFRGRLYALMSRLCAPCKKPTPSPAILIFSESVKCESTHSWLRRTLSTRSRG